MPGTVCPVRNSGGWGTGAGSIAILGQPVELRRRWSSVPNSTLATISERSLFAYVSGVAISKEQVEHVARLARLKLTSAEISSLTGELGQILAHVEQLQQLDTSQVEPTQHVAVERMPLRADTPSDGLDNETALSSSPRSMNGGFAVPAFVDE